MLILVTISNEIRTSDAISKAEPRVPHSAFSLASRLLVISSTRVGLMLFQTAKEISEYINQILCYTHFVRSVPLAALQEGD